jgi:hypothetical protein
MRWQMAECEVIDHLRWHNDGWILRGPRIGQMRRRGPGG